MDSCTISLGKGIFIYILLSIIFIFVTFILLFPFINFYFRFDGSTMGEDIVKEFKSEEEDLIAKKQIVAIGLRFTCSKV